MISMVRSENEPVILALGFRLEAILVVVTENSETELSLSAFSDEDDCFSFSSAKALVLIATLTAIARVAKVNCFIPSFFKILSCKFSLFCLNCCL